MNWLVVGSATAAVLALLVLLVGRLLRPAPAVMHLLWLSVLLKLALPPLFELPVTLPWLETEASQSVLVLERVAVARPSPAVTMAEPPPGGMDRGDLLLMIWAAGTAAFATLLVMSVVRGQRRVRRLQPAPAWLQREIVDLAVLLDVRVPRLLDDPQAHAPYIWSLFGARLLLPVATLAAASPKGRRAVLAHELAHLRRGDHLVAHLELLLAAALWWHPLFWFARGRLRLWAELACDAWAVASVPGARLDYASVLIDAVAKPDSAVPGLTVLAARPAARAAFERRLTMILDEKMACRVRRGWWLPLAAVGLGLFTAPVVAQKPEQKAVRVEIKVNGKDLSDLTPAERRAALRLLQQGEAEPEAQPEPKPLPRKQPQKALQPRTEPERGDPVAEDMPSAKELRELIQQGLREARIEVLQDKDLKQLGIQEDVGRLIDSIGKGEGFQQSLDAVIRKAMQGAGKQAILEIRSDVDLQKLGLGDGIEKMITGLLQDQGNQKWLGDFAREAMRSGLQEAKVEILDDQDLKGLGIEIDVTNLLDGIFDGKGSFDRDLQKLIDKAMRAAMQQAHEAFGEREPEAPQPKPRKTKKAKG